MDWIVSRMKKRSFFHWNAIQFGHERWTADVDRSNESAFWVIFENYSHSEAIRAVENYQYFDGNLGQTSASTISRVINLRLLNTILWTFSTITASEHFRMSSIEFVAWAHIEIFHTSLWNSLSIVTLIHLHFCCRLFIHPLLLMSWT